MKNYQKNLINWQKALKNKPEFKFISRLLKKFSQAEIFLVGGMVRDLILGRESKDYDFIVRKVKAKDLEKFLSLQGQVNLVGKHFGIFKFQPKGWEGPEIDVALPRTEHSTAFLGGYRDFAIQSNPNLAIEKDLLRRDFTINAIAWDLKNKKFVDPTDGLIDLTKKIIQAVGNPSQRFKEDYSRMLRAIRFACQLNFQIEKNTWQAIKSLISKINAKNKKGERIVPYEVIGREFLKSFISNPVLALELYDKSGALKEIAPELLKMKGCPQPKNWHSEGDVWQHTRLCLKNLSSKKFKNQFKGDPAWSPELVMGLLFHDLGKPYTIKTPAQGADRIRFNGHDAIGGKITEKICHRLKLSAPPDISLDIPEVVWLTKKHLLLIHGNINEIKNTTLEKYFFKNPKWGKDFLKLLFIDAISTIPQRGQPDLTNFKILLKRLKQLEKLKKKTKDLPKPLVNGHDLINTFHLESGPKIGQLLEILREAQLQGKIKTKKEGLKFIKEYL